MLRIKVAKEKTASMPFFSLPPYLIGSARSVPTAGSAWCRSYGYEKMKAEQDKYRDWLLHQEPSEILNHTYEYTMREDIVMCMEELELEPEKARAFIGNDVELLRNTLYQDQYIYMAV